jgi:hypothetical protein
MNSFVKKFSAAAVIASTLVFSVSAFAQSGSRLCGWTATDPIGNTVGVFDEVRQKDASVKKQCDMAISDMKKAIDKDPNLSKLQWAKVHEDTCESVGGKFTSKTNPSADMCDYMEAKHGYKVMKMKDGSKTVYTKM